MVIERIALKNIKIYADTEIFMHPGVNFIKGKNGAGKSTLIESIGYALFNYSDAKSVNEDFLTYGKTEGAIEIDFTGAEQKKYTVVRTISVKQNKRSWLVYERGNDIPFELYYEEEKQAFLAEAMGIGKEKDLAWLFKDIIGVRQGAFKEPFEKPLEDRKKYFNRIFGVEGYTRAFDQLSAVSSELRHRNELVLKDISYLLEAVKGLDERKEEKESLQVSASEADKQQKALLCELKVLEEQLMKHRQIRDKKTNTEKLILGCEQNIKNLTSLLGQKETQKKVSLTAADKQKFHEKGYQAYLLLKEILAGLDQKAAMKRDLFVRSSTAQNSLSKLDAKIIAEKKSLELNEQNISLEKSELLASKDKSQKNLHSLNTELIAVQKNNILLKNLEKNVLSFENYIDKGKEFIENNLNVQVLKYEQMQQITNQLKSEQEALRALLPFEKKLEDIKAKLEEQKKSKSVMEEKLLTMQKYEAELEKGACPFFISECAAAKQQGKAGLQIQKNEIETFLQELSTNLDENEKSLISLMQYEGIGVKLNMVMQKQSENDTEIKKVQLLLSDLAAKPSNWNMAQKIVEHSKEFSKIEQPPQTFAAQLFLEYIELLSENPYAAAKKYIQFFYAFSDWIKAMKDNLHNQILLQKSKTGEIDVQAAACNSEVQNADNRLVVIAGLEKSLLTAREAIGQTLMQKEQAQLEVDKFFNELKQYDGLESEMEEKKAEAILKEEDFRQYIQNKAEAEKINEVINAILEIEQTIIKENTSLYEHQTVLAEYEKAYDMNKEKALQDEVSQLNRNKGELTAKLSHIQSEALRVQKEIEQKLESQQKLEQQNTRQTRIIEADQIIKNVRAAMKAAGPKIASIFRNRIEARADSIYRNVSREGVNLLWTDSYEIELHDMWKGLQRKRTFKQLSGGEKMTAALAVRLSLLEEFSAAKIGFFDEPTDNMDISRKENLADILASLCADFSQVFVISHDDTFDKMTDNVIFLSADAKGTAVYR